MVSAKSCYARLGSTWFGWVCLESTRLGLVGLGWAWLSQAQLGLAGFGSPELGSAGMDLAGLCYIYPMKIKNGCESTFSHLLCLFSFGERTLFTARFLEIYTGSPGLLYTIRYFFTNRNYDLTGGILRICTEGFFIHGCNVGLSEKS